MPDAVVGSEYRTYVHAILRARADRLELFSENQDIFGEPAWDILLCLVGAAERYESWTITDVAAAARLPLSSTQRWVRRLSALGLLTMERDKFDSRKLILAPTKSATAKMRSYLEHLKSRRGQRMID